VDWQQGEGRVRVRIHRRVLAGLEREESAELHGLLLGTVSAGASEILVEDYTKATPGANSLPPIGYFRLAQGKVELADADRERFLGRFEEPWNVLLLLERSAEGVRAAELLLRAGAEPNGKPAQNGAPAALGHRVLFREGVQERPDLAVEPVDRSPRRFLWPVVAVAAGLATGVFGYLALSRDARTPENHAVKRVHPMHTPPAGDAPPPGRAPAPAREAPPDQQADRSTEPAKPLTRAEVQQQIRGVLNRWSESLLRGDFETHASLYAPSVGPYFTKSHASRAEVADEIRQMVKRYGAMTTHRITDVTISPVDANHAIVNFRKQWGTVGRKFAGEEREQLKFVREGSDWLIASEQELKVYWVRKR
jgi:hypothetical protein